MADYLQLMRTFNGKVGGGNYTYYKLTQSGHVMLELISTEGDADLYVSDQNLTPEYDNYEWQSTTCGADQIEIEDTMKRPIGIGIYGHPSQEMNQFVLKVFMSQQGDEISSNNEKFGRSNKAGPSDDEESILWSILVGVLKIVFDVIV